MTRFWFLGRVNLRFEEIPNSILGYNNSYEDKWGIKTQKIECFVKRDNWAVFYAYKSDNSKTVFFARKGKRASNDGWSWFCPSESEVELGFPALCELYQIINAENEKKRQ